MGLREFLGLNKHSELDLNGLPSLDQIVEEAYTHEYGPDYFTASYFDHEPGWRRLLLLLERLNLKKHYDLSAEYRYDPDWTLHKTFVCGRGVIVIATVARDREWLEVTVWNRKFTFTNDTDPDFSAFLQLASGSDKIS